MYKFHVDLVNTECGFGPKHYFVYTLALKVHQLGLHWIICVFAATFTTVCVCFILMQVILQ